LSAIPRTARLLVGPPLPPLAWNALNVNVALAASGSRLILRKSRISRPIALAAMLNQQKIEISRLALSSAKLKSSRWKAGADHACD
jgi:hypothetical protein